MRPQVLVPWADVAARCADQPLRIAVYDGVTEPTEDLGEVACYVLPYDRGAAPNELLARLPALRVVQSLSAGVEKLEPLLPQDVLLCGGRGLHDASVAEHALGLILAAQRDLPRWLDQQRSGDWSRAHSRSLADSRVAVVGYGSIGRALERRLVAGDAEVLRVARTARDAERVHGVAELPGLLPGVDVAVLILPENPGTIGAFGADELAALPDGALVVNVGRGRTVDTDALVAEVLTGRLRAALDVVDPEPLPPDHPLWRAPGVLITPHVAGGSATFYPRAKRLVVEQVRRFAAGEPPLNVIPRRSV